jgi:hypothetical protein
LIASSSFFTANAAVAIALGFDFTARSSGAATMVNASRAVANASRIRSSMGFEARATRSLTLSPLGPE